MHNKASYFKGLAILVVALVAFFGFSTKYFQKANAASAGPSASHTDAPGEDNCTSCHTDFTVNSGSGSISFAGLPVNYVPGASYNITATVTSADALIYGFQTTSIDSAGRQRGTYTLPTTTPAQVRTNNGIVNGNSRSYVSHTVDGTIPTVFGLKSWNFTWNAPTTRVGRVGFHMAGNAANGDGGNSGDRIYTKRFDTFSGTAVSTFDGDGKADISVFRPSEGNWYSLNSTNGAFAATNFGISSDKIVPGDYDGDGKTDQAVYRASSGTWYLNRSTSGFAAVQFGAISDIPAVGDYSGDGKFDIAVFRPSNGVWYIYNIVTGAVTSQQFGISTDSIAQADYDGDGKTDIAVYRKSNGTWYVWRSTTNSLQAVQFGISSDSPVQGDYDGDGRADVAVFRGSTGFWYVLKSSNGSVTSTQFGVSTVPNDLPVAADYDGDGLFDIAVYRSGLWYVLNSSNNSVFGVAFGAAGDKAVPSAYFAP
jgi:FG-GAP-like repeat